MARDIYNRVVSLGQPIAADATRLILPDIGDEDQLVQNFSLTYQQNVNQIWEVGSSFTYFVAGRTQGQIQVGRIVGSKGIGTKFIQKYADVCQMTGNHFSLQFQAGCTDGSNVGTLSVKGVVITNIGYTVQAQDMLINENFTMLFALLSNQ